MKIVSITVSHARVFNLGNYENFRCEGAVTVALEDGDTPEQARAKAFEELKTILNENYQTFKPKKGEQR